ncbi:23S ribosomal RNA methyltransferase Erm [Cohnella massiliensis]|uniref:23S ribosomal RNA methyltransferase Erm n=1 Tax=Cohnella massiliensis TaxID=1816691 RepID=UPI00111A7431|nr:23S ribosomal RNA methyltransferase Erm [Cohnella massiliensis]
MQHGNKRRRKARKCKSGPNFSGQHLLHNPKTIGDMIGIVSPRQEDLVLDIGAGKGALTFPLAGKAGRVIAVENDPAFAGALRKKAELSAKIAVAEKDFREMKLPNRPFCVVSNIPFSITTAVMEKLMGSDGVSFRGGALLIEYGAARRFTAERTADPRVLAWRMNFELKLIKEVPRTHFAPPPQVDGAILRIVRKERPLLGPGQHRAFHAFASYALRDPRLPLAEALKGIFTAPQLKIALKEAMADRGDPAMALREAQWAKLFQTMVAKVPSFRWPRGK